jgi:MFS family permease
MTDRGIETSQRIEATAPVESAVAVEMTAVRPSAFQALKAPNYRAFWIGSFLSNTGTWMQSVAQGWLVLQLTNSAFWLGLMGFASSLPSLIFSLMGGVLADRFNRRKLLFVTQSIMMASALALGLLTASHAIVVGEILVLGFISGVANSINGPAYQAILPDLVGEKDLLNAIALDSSQFNLSRVIGPTVGGLALAAFGVAACFLLNAASFLALLAALALIRLPIIGNVRRNTVWRDLMEGIHYVRHTPLLVVLLSIILVMSFFGMPYFTMLPVFARDLLGAGATGLGYLYGAAGTGAVIGTLTLAFLGDVKHKGITILICSSLFGLSIVLFAHSRNLRTSLVLLMWVGATMIGALTLAKTLLQSTASIEMRGRVISMYFFCAVGFFPLGNLIAGTLAGWRGAPFALEVGGSVVFVFSIAMLAFVSRIRRWVGRTMPVGNS